MTAPIRRPMPTKRLGSRCELRIDNCKIFVTVNRYPDGKPCEMWLDMGKEGSALRHFMHGFAIAVSLLLQYGVPVDVIAHAFEGLSGGPSGDVTGHPTITRAKSIIDMVAQLLRTEHAEKSK